MKKNTSKIENKGISVLRNLIDNMDCVTHSFGENNTEISWDGDIKLYKNPDVDDKGNLSSIIRVQVKSRTKKIPSSNSINFLINKKDLKNYLLENGTMFFVIIFNNNNEFKIFYIDLLPYNLRKLLKEEVNGKNEIKVKLKYMPNDPIIFEKILRNFAIDKKQQERISDKVFEQENMAISVDGKRSKIQFYDWGYKKDKITALIGEEKYVYELDENDNIINIELVTLGMIKEPFNIQVKDKLGNIYFDKVDCIYTKDSAVINIGKSFKMYQKENKFNIKIKGTLKERINSLNFLIQIDKFKGFYINEEWVKLNGELDNPNIFKSELEIYTKILNFIKAHHIDKDINLDKWTWDEINKFVIWIRAIDEGIPIRVENFKTSVLGSIKIQDIRFSIFAERKEDGKIFVKSIWNSDINGKYLFMRGNPDDVDEFETTYIYDFLNKEAYLSDDINFLEMKKYYNENEIKENEETSINMQALEAILAYDENKNKKLLEYANFLLDKIINIESMHEIAIINKCQIKRRLGKLTLDDKFELMKIFEKKKDNLIYSISINLLIDKKEDAKRQLENLTEYEKEEYLKYPISIFLR